MFPKRMKNCGKAHRAGSAPRVRLLSFEGGNRGCHWMGVMGSAEWCTHEGNLGKHIQDSNSDNHTPDEAERAAKEEDSGKVTFGFPVQPLRGSLRRLYAPTAVCGVLWSGGSTWLPVNTISCSFMRFLLLFHRAVLFCGLVAERQYNPPSSSSSACTWCIEGRMESRAAVTDTHAFQGTAGGWVGLPIAKYL